MIHYALEIKKPETHLAYITVQLDGIRNEHVDFILPSWSPGSYVIRDYAKNVVKAEALDSDGRSLPCKKINKNTWRVVVAGKESCSFSYQVYCHEPGTPSSFVDDLHASLHGPSIFVFPKGREKQICRLALKYPETWKRISTGLNQAKNLPQTFEAQDYDALLDCPIEIGNHIVSTFLVEDIPHHVALYGHGNVDLGKLVSDIKKIVEVAVQVFNHIPYQHYTFIIQLLSLDGGGGLEHGNSTLIQVNRWKFQPEEEYRKKLSLIAHEFFHLWNVKRLAPKPLVTFDYNAENYTDLLWEAEGITSYYEDLLLLRAGLYSPEQYFEAVLDDYKAHLETPGGEIQSLCESSFDAWIKFYKLNESARNLTISYYRKGALIGLALDLLLRKATRSQVTLDHVLRSLYEETYLKSRKGYTLDDFKETCQKVSGESFEDFFAKYVEGREPFSLEEFLEPFGLHLVEKKEKGHFHDGYLGIEIKRREKRAILSGVPWKTPAFDAGLCPGDEVVAWDGMRVDAETLPSRIQESRPETTHVVHLFRQEVLKEVKVVTGRKPAEWRVEQVEDASAASLELLKNWIGTTRLRKEEKPEKEQARRRSLV